VGKLTRKKIGWDIGGAHQKAVLLNECGQVEHTIQLSCHLWLGLDRLENSLITALKEFDVDPDQAQHLVTMTGELVDLFANRHEGVVQISTLVTKILGDDTWFYCTDEAVMNNSFLPLSKVLLHTMTVASANWHASASLLAQLEPDVLLIDIGSTTTDIIAIEGGKVINSGLTDAERMEHDSLVYTGVVRTPVMAIARKLMLDGKQTNVAAEHFSTMADVYRLIKELPFENDLSDTADGQAKTLLASAQRLARMVGHDAKDKPMLCWQQFANDCRENQVEQIKTAVIKQIKGNMTIVGAGAGSFLTKEIAHRLDLPYVGLESLFKHEVGHDLAVFLPAYAVAKLASLRDLS